MNVKIDGTRVYYEGLAAARTSPSAAVLARVKPQESWFETDTGSTYQCLTNDGSTITWQQTVTDGASHVTTAPPVELTTVARTALSLSGEDAGYLVWDTTLSALYRWSGSAWVAYTEESGGAKAVTVINPDETQTIVHIASGTASTGSVEAGSWINRSGYDRGSIEMAVVDSAPTGDVSGTFEIAYSMDAGVSQSGWATLATIVNIDASDDSQTLIVDIADTSVVKTAPYFKVREVLAGTGMTFGVNVYLERLKG